ncbi:MAG: hypothetical protein Q4G63_07325 [Bacteroidia bacterium]|nr:hypothetical protein [Bacteroidia bacterium]
MKQKRVEINRFKQIPKSALASLKGGGEKKYIVVIINGVRVVIEVPAED